MKRIVFKHRSGLHQILGTDDDFKQALKLENVPVYVEPVQYPNHQGAARFVKMHPRFVLYEECPAGKMNAFHPEQQ